MELTLGIIGVTVLALFVFSTLGLSILFTRTSNKQKKAELAKARRQVKVYPGHDKFTDGLLAKKYKIFAEYVADKERIDLYFEVPDIDGRKVIEHLKYDADDIIDYIKIL